VVMPKNQALWVIASFFLAGVGSMINRDVGTGVLPTTPRDSLRPPRPACGALWSQMPWCRC
jgi:hypothetical protein